jgi:hypothetical protein
MADLCKTLQPAFSRYSWPLFLSMLVGLLTVATHKTLSSLAQTHSISALSRFLNRYRWPAALLRTYRQQLITQQIHKRYLKKRGRRPTIYLILDDTVIPKRGQHFPGLGLHYSATQRQVTPGHDLVFAFLVVGTRGAPWDWRLYRNCRFDPHSYRKKIVLAIELLQSFALPYPGRVRVLVDSFYCCQQLIRAAQARGFGVVGLVKRNRCVNGHKVEQVETGEVVRLRGADFLVRLAFRRRRQQRQCIAGTELWLDPPALRAEYRKRWAIETFFLAAKQQFGLGDYRVRGQGALERWVELVLLAYVLASLSRWGRKVRWQAAKEQSAWRLVRMAKDNFPRLCILFWVLTMLEQVLRIPWALTLS